MKKHLPQVEQRPAGIGSRPDLEPDSAAATAKTVLLVEGMDCASCATTVERRVAGLPGMRRAAVNFSAGRLDAEHAPQLSRGEIERTVKAAGYSVSETRIEEPRIWLTKRTLSVLASTLLFVLGFSLGIAGAPEGLRVLVFLAAIVVGGWQIFRAALAGIKARHLDMNVLMSGAVIGAVGIGEWAEATLVVVLFAAGNALQSYATDRTRGAVRALARITPDEVLVRRNGSQFTVPVEEVVVGETVIVRPGERLAIDGEVVEGASALNEAPITGENAPVEKQPGDEVYSGSLNGAGGLLIRSTKVAEDSTLQKITHLVEQAQASKAPSEQFVDRFSRYYTPLVVAAAAGLALVPPAFGASFDEWFYRALALLIIACPCALVISTPVTVVSGIGAASRRGILIKGGAALEAVGKLRALAFDKTGTLTEGRPSLSRVVALDGVDQTIYLRLAAALERRSEHPLAHAVLSAVDVEGLPDVENFRSIPGRGAEGNVRGRRYMIGSPRFLTSHGLSLQNAAQALETLEQAGETPVLLADSTTILAVLGIADTLRGEAKFTVRELREAGIEELIMLTGDADAPARRTADALGISYRSGLLPEQKIEAVRELVAEHGSAGMVGDGVNDAPALAASSVGIAMGAAGTDVALETADVALMQDDLPRLAESVKLSRAASGIIRQNIAASILIKGVFVMLAPFGLVTLWLAVLADMGTSIAVTLNGLRLFRRG
ncbi:heavy metal translocating P-type ATPase [soil metagenome]